MKKIIIIILLILSEILIIVFISYEVKKKQITPTIINVNPIKKTSIIFPEKTTLKFFYELKPYTKIVVNEKWLPTTVTYTINKDALNEKFNYPAEKNAFVYRIIALGDSFTFGENVNTENNWTEKLEDLLNTKLNCKNTDKFEVINLGVKGYDVQYAVNRFYLRGRKYNSDMVIWFLKDDDFETIEELIQPIRKEFVDELKRKGTYKQMSKNTNFEETLEGYQLLSERFRKRYNNKFALDFNKKILNDFLNKYKNKVVVFNYTSFKINGIKEMMEEFTKKSSSFFWKQSLTPNFDNKIYAFAPFNYHPNEKGYQLIADNLFKYLIDNKILSCN